MDARLAARELRALEPIFHRSAAGSPRSAFEAMVDEQYWEVGASGAVYEREFVLDVVEERHRGEPEDRGLHVDDFAVRLLEGDTWLVTYALLQDERHSRRSTIWQRRGERWVALYHQGTLS
ncbi:DUF4440 domain-containing protein [Humibacter ginsenosidimutans]|uniref:DUF4440 domain-containing protein n=1 Tax=Humibacter ginsenosidimutans TaxID=2599293 RepID=A0A5B8M4V8_9MICO|nr:DUF4440 domain-containing protein [Humibacter ginsenosidimutans]QDZ15039.1 DUF4440 domain-containing protein [Humibacter ginsenosidimutans]